MGQRAERSGLAGRMDGWIGGQSREQEIEWMKVTEGSRQNQKISVFYDNF
jgi:hypothetical protein